MPSTKARRTRAKPKKPKRVAKKRASPADPKERLKPVSLHGMELDEVLQKLLRVRPSR